MYSPQNKCSLKKDWSNKKLFIQKNSLLQVISIYIYLEHCNVFNAIVERYIIFIQLVTTDACNTLCGKCVESNTVKDLTLFVLCSGIAYM